MPMLFCSAVLRIEKLAKCALASLSSYFPNRGFGE
jgi:hypothetical protein